MANVTFYKVGRFYKVLVAYDSYVYISNPSDIVEWLFIFVCTTSHACTTCKVNTFSQFSFLFFHVNGDYSTAFDSGCPLVSVLFWTSFHVTALVLFKRGEMNKPRFLARNEARNLRFLTSIILRGQLVFLSQWAQHGATSTVKSALLNLQNKTFSFICIVSYHNKSNLRAVCMESRTRPRSYKAGRATMATVTRRNIL